MTDRINDDPETEAAKWNPADTTYYFHMGLHDVICQNVFCKKNSTCGTQIQNLVTQIIEWTINMKSMYSVDEG